MDQETNEILIKGLIFQLKEWYRYFQSKWLTILVAGILGGAIGLYYAWDKKYVYTASITYALDDERGGGLGGGALGLASSLGFDLGTGGGNAFGSANLMELMHTRSLVEKTLLSAIDVNGKKLTIAEFYVELNGLRKSWTKKPELLQLHFPIDSDRSNFTRIQDSVLESIYANFDDNQLSITQKDKKVAFGTIEVKSGNEFFAKLFCETLVKVVTDFYVETRRHKALNNATILQKQVDSVRAVLNAAITGVAVANDNTFNLNSALTVNRTSAAKRQVDVQANTAILTQLVANLEMAKVALLKETPLFQIIDRPIFPLKKEKISKLKCLIIGGILAGMLAVLFLVLKREWDRIFANDTLVK